MKNLETQTTDTIEPLRVYLRSRIITVRVDRTYTTEIALARIEELERVLNFLDQLDEQGMQESAARWQAGFDRAREDFMRSIKDDK